FPLLGSLVLRHPYRKIGDPGQSLFLHTDERCWWVEIVDGPPRQQPTYIQAMKAEGKRKKGKTARCLFCRRVHQLETVKAKGQAEEYEDCLLIVVDVDESGRRFFRLPTSGETAAAMSVVIPERAWPYSAAPDEAIPAGNTHTVMASGY